MSHTPLPLIALDIDGTVNVLAPFDTVGLLATDVIIPGDEVPDSPFFNARPGVTTRVRVTVRPSVIDWLNRLIASGTLEVGWATTWEDAAHRFAAAVGLPTDLPVLTRTVDDPPEPALARAHDSGAWKAQVLGRTVPIERLLIWLDDAAHPWAAPPAGRTSRPVREHSPSNELVPYVDGRIGITDEMMEQVEALLHT